MKTTIKAYSKDRSLLGEFSLKDQSIDVTQNDINDIASICYPVRLILIINESIDKTSTTVEHGTRVALKLVS